MKRILVLAPHPDDEVLGCGASIRKHVMNGNKVWVVIMTNASVTDSVRFTKEKLSNIRTEASAANSLLGVEELFFEDLPAPALDQYPLYKVAEIIATIIQRLKSEILYIPHRGDIHNDHKVIFDAAMVASRPNGYNYVQSIYAYETLSETEWAHPYLGESFVPTIFEKISNEHFSYKLEAMRSYKSQLRQFPNSRSLETLEALARFRGSTVGTELAEAFMLIREIVS